MTSWSSYWPSLLMLLDFVLLFWCSRSKQLLWRAHCDDCALLMGKTTKITHIIVIKWNYPLINEQIVLTTDKLVNRVFVCGTDLCVFVGCTLVLYARGCEWVLVRVCPCYLGKTEDVPVATQREIFLFWTWVRYKTHTHPHSHTHTHRWKHWDRSFWSTISSSLLPTILPFL